MNKLTDARFERIVQLMTLWSEQWQTHILLHGSPLDAEEIQLAECAGIASPEKVRILKVPNVPLPHYPQVHRALIEFNLFNPNATGLTVGYGIFLRFDSFPRQYWLAHELVHVGQYERMNSILNCQRQYLRECFTDGYEASGLEQEAHRTARKCLANKGIVFDFGDETEPDAGE